MRLGLHCSEETKKKMKQSNLRTWADKNLRDKHSEVMKEVYKDNALRMGISKRVKEQWNDSQFSRRVIRTKLLRSVREIEMSETEKAWLAAAIDGEGSIRIDSYNGYHHPRVRISNTCLEFLEEAKRITGVGGIYLDYRQKGNHLPCYSWCTNKTTDCCAIIAQIFPYLIIKREVARDVLVFAKLRIETGAGGKEIIDQLGGSK